MRTNSTKFEEKNKETVKATEVNIDIRLKLHINIENLEPKYVLKLTKYANDGRSTKYIVRI